ncbi:hypothetical protein [Streptomyces sp. MBT33]|uniref:hypothetical protein n=1 Tax=Streptomyces sp. MBT33 TaxID=1488363 RepID=UPI00190C0FAD|nr:hypothetical protein [Streptomyces sp. MBT33]MBK3645505.1 hypothetical protein [Streptomyces sp. MBT33]
MHLAVPNYRSPPGRSTRSATNGPSKALPRTSTRSPPYVAAGRAPSPYRAAGRTALGSRALSLAEALTVVVPGSQILLCARPFA